MHVPLLLVAFAAVVFCAAASAADPIGTTTVLAVEAIPAKAPPGTMIRLKYAFDATGPTAEADAVFVHVFDAAGKRVFQGDHNPPVQTNWIWKGRTVYDRKIGIPADLPDGTYTVAVGLYGTKGREELVPGPGVTERGERAYDAGTIIVDRAAPAPKLDTEGERTLDLSAYELTFSDEFDTLPDVSPHGTAADGRRTTWMAHTPWNGDFGDAAFGDPAEGHPFTVKDGVLRIEARKDPAFAAVDGYKRPWRAGLLCSGKADGTGFAQRYGYFECRMKMPPGPGTWPAFWLSSIGDPTGKRRSSIEIDIIEYYGQFDAGYQSVVHVWQPEPHRADGSSITMKPGQAVSGFHDYGATVDPEYVTIYFDGIAVWRSPTPPEHQAPLQVLVNFAMGSGWPIDKTPNPSVLEVEHVRVYKKR